MAPSGFRIRQAPASRRVLRLTDCDGQNHCCPKDVPTSESPEPVNIMLDGKGCDSVENLDRRSSSWTFQMGHKYHDMYPRNTNAEDASGHRSSQKGKDIDSPTVPLEEVRPCDTLLRDF